MLYTIIFIIGVALEIVLLICFMGLCRNVDNMTKNIYSIGKNLEKITNDLERKNN